MILIPGEYLAQPDHPKDDLPFSVKEFSPFLTELATTTYV